MGKREKKERKKKKKQELIFTPLSVSFDNLENEELGIPK